MKYTTVYFDLDNTLLDFSAAERSAINRLLTLYGITPKSDYVRLYSSINRKYWESFERGEIAREDIFEGRFREFLSAVGAVADAEKMAADYFTLLAAGHDLMPGAKEVLEYLKGRGYTVCATTNGVTKTQYKRIAESGIGVFFDYVFISEEVGVQKPERGYFDYVLNNTPEKDRERVLIVGDSQSSDILGGINSGIDTCWLNPAGEPGKYKATYEIKNIKELCGIL